MEAILQINPKLFVKRVDVLTCWFLIFCKTNFQRDIVLNKKEGNFVTQKTFKAAKKCLKIILYVNKLFLAFI